MTAPKDADVNNSYKGSMNAENRIHQLEQQLLASNARVESCEKTISYARKELRSMDSKCGRMQRKIDEQEEELSALRRQYLETIMAHNGNIAPKDTTTWKPELQLLKRPAQDSPYVKSWRQQAGPVLIKSFPSSASPPTLKKPKPETPTKVVPCAKCYVHGWDCDDNEPCTNCTLRKKSTKCKRVMCKHFSAGACKNATCRFAHEEDGYTYLTPYIKLRREQLGVQEPAARFKALGEVEESYLGTAEDDDDDDKEDGGVTLA